ncbi:hypothetical protein B566_EDAN006393 [Ephemera danica]|nr:hypothetical protein B566_EDAN006393 [Ephemera danica]
MLCLGGDARSQSTVDSMLDSLRHVLPEGGYHELDSEQLRRDFTNAKFSSQHRGLLETVAGILRADECMKAVQGNFLALGGEIRDDALVTSLHADGDVVRINIAPNSHMTAEKVAVCAGPWTAKFLEPLLNEKLPLTPLRVMISQPWPRQVIDPDEPGQGPTNDDQKCQDVVSDYISRTLPGLDATSPEIFQPCIYTVLDLRKHQ